MFVFFFWEEKKRKTPKNSCCSGFVSTERAQCVICMKAHHEHRKTYDFINMKGSFDRESLVELWAKLPTRLKQVETWQNQNNFADMIKQRQLLGADSKKFCKYFPNSVDRKPQTPVFMLSSSHLDFIIGAFKFLGHSVSSAFLIHCLKHDWVEGSNLCLEFFQMLSTQLWSNAWASSWRHCKYECCVPRRQHGTRKWGRACTS